VLSVRHVSAQPSSVDQVRAFVDFLAARFQATAYWDNGLPDTAG
jgi:hypothetical protein